MQCNSCNSTIDCYKWQDNLTEIQATHPFHLVLDKYVAAQEELWYSPALCKILNLPRPWAPLCQCNCRELHRMSYQNLESQVPPPFCYRVFCLKICAPFQSNSSLPYAGSVWFCVPSQPLAILLAYLLGTSRLNLLLQLPAFLSITATHPLNICSGGFLKNSKILMA